MSVFRISVYDKNRTFRCQIGNPASLEVTVRHNLVSTLTMTVPLAHKSFEELKADGARLRVAFKGEHLISGPIVADALSSDGVKGSYTVTVEDDFRVLREILGWPVPDAAISAQSAREYYTYLGNAEYCLKTAVTHNGVTRLAVPGLTVATNLNRGATIPGGVPVRMHPLYDQFFPAVEDAGLGVTVKQTGANLVLDVYQPVTHPRSLSVKGRTLKQVGMTRTRPTASRVVVGGPGEGTARAFRSMTDTARETKYGMRAEVFQDARDAKDDAGTGQTATGIMDARATEALGEHGAKNGVSLTLAGSGIFQYGPGGFHVGDRVPIKITDDITITEVIRECTLKWVSPEYASFAPVVGDLTDQPERITAQRIAALARRQRDQEAR